ncbi:MAG: hypothetical protein JXQ71_06050 [Verrucomicrobia bacterium]|nr:hypothetical protein [Verrucomicrobiota bacterium]
MMDLVVAMGILMAALIPMSFIFYQEFKLTRAYYYEALAMSIVDGEMEVLAAGEWRHCPEGASPFAPKTHAVTNLPPGRFLLTRSNTLVRLEWHPAQPGTGRPIRRAWRTP